MDPTTAWLRLCLMLTVITAGLVPGPAGADSPGATPLELVRVSPDHAPLAGSSIIEITLRNTGATTLTARSGLHLETIWSGPDGVPFSDWTDDERRRHGFGEAVEPGDTFTLKISLRAIAAGRHTLTLNLVRGGEKARVQTLTAEVVARGRATVWSVWMVALLGVAAAASRRYADRLPPVLQLAVSFLPVLAVWAAAVIAQKMFSEITGLPLHDRAQYFIYATSAVCVVPVVLFPGRLRNAVSAVVVIALTILTFADIVHLRALGSIVSVASLSSAGQLHAARGSVAGFFRAADAPLLALLLSGIILAFFWRIPKERRSIDRLARIVCLGAVILFAKSVPADIERMVKGDYGLIVFSSGSTVAVLGLYSTHVFDIGRVLHERHLRGDISDADRRGVIEYFRKRDAEREPGAMFGAAAGHDLIVVQAEAFQEWVVDLLIGGVEVTPFLNSLSPRRLYFPNILDQTREGNTSDAEYLLLNSQHPLPNGAIAFRRESNNFLSLAHVLGDLGYTTLSAHPGVPGFWNRAFVHPRYGFGQTLFAEELGPGPIIGWGLADRIFFERMADRVLDQRRPYFALLITMGLHHPFDTFPDEFKEMSIGALEGSRLGNYLHGMRHFDTSIKEFLDRLEKAGRLESTLVAIYGDHDAHMKMSPTLLQLMGRRWDPSLEVRSDRVPLFVFGPVGDDPGIRQTVGGQIDFAPTLLGLLGIDTPASFAGHSLLSQRSSLAARVDGVVMDDQRIFIPAGRHIPQGGACYNFPQGGLRPTSDCRGLVQEGHAEASASVFLANHDLARAIVEKSD